MSRLPRDPLSQRTWYVPHVLPQRTVCALQGIYKGASGSRLLTSKGVKDSLSERLERPLLDHINAGNLPARLKKQTRRVRTRHSVDRPCTQCKLQW